MMRIKLLRQAQVFFLLHWNYRKPAFVKNWNFYVFTFPVFGCLIYWCVKPVIKLGNRALIDRIFSFTACRSTLRFLTARERDVIARSVRCYNSNVGRRVDAHESVVTKIKQLRSEGYCDLGRVFSVDEYRAFQDSLRNELCYLEQVPIQCASDPVPFRVNENPLKDGKAPYVMFPPSTTMRFGPLKEFLSSDRLKVLVDGYLGFRYEIYSCVSWYNPTTVKWHYVHKMHRDYDDYKFVCLVVYWNDVGASNGALSYIPRSHKTIVGAEDPVLLKGDAGQAFLVDMFGYHAGKPVSQGCRYATFIRFGMKNNHDVVMNGSALTPTENA